MPLNLRLDPRPINYESAIQVEEDDGPDADVDPYVETRDWAPVTPEPRALPDTVVFVDGVQRVEMRVIGEDNGRMVYGALASVAVGAVFHSSGRAATQSQLPDRVLALSDGGGDTPPLALPCGPMTLDFRVTNSASTGLAGVFDALTSARRDAETRLGESLVQAGHPLVIMDGRLNFGSSRNSIAVGLVKTMQKQYLEGDHLRVLSEIRLGQRTPLFRIGRDRAVYSWYMRLGELALLRPPVDRPRPAGNSGLREPSRHRATGGRDLAAPSPLRLPPRLGCACAAEPLPGGGLENLLRHELGDHEWIRRHIEVHFHRQGVGV